MNSPRRWINQALPPLLIALLASSAAYADPALSQGSWQKHEYTFQYMGFTSTYSCDGLADKLKVLLLAAGARADLKSQPGACAEGFGRPDKFAQAYLTFYTLVPLAPDAPAGSGAVPGLWRAVALASRSPRELALGDCELVEQFRHDLLPMFAARSIDSHMTCVPHQESGSVINLKFEVFAAAPKRPPA